VDKQGKGTYERIMEVIALLIRESISFHIRIDVDENNVHSIESLLQDMKQRGYEDIYLGFSPIGEEICYKEMEMEPALNNYHTSLIWPKNMDFEQIPSISRIS
jgi:sulfatase maturation enzyme AslB (radical SAM superfamily)